MSQGIELLKASYLFRDLPDRILEQVASRLVYDQFGPREAIFREGADGDTLYILIKGQVEIRKRDPESGIEFHLTRLDAPAAFGEIALLHTGPRSATVATLSDTEVAMLKGPDFHSLVNKLPEFALAVARGLASRVDELSRERRISYGQLNRMDYDPQVLGLLSKKTLRELKLVPLAYNGTSLQVAMVNPEDITALNQLRSMIRGVMIEPVVVSELDFKRFMDTVYERVLKDAEQVKSEKESLDLSDLMSSLDEDVKALNAHGDESVVKLARNLLIQAIRANASDLQLEPRADRLHVRVRIDGQLSSLQELPRSLHRDLVNRFKTMASLNVEDDSPQHGEILVSEEQLEITFRVDTLPTRYGEKLVISMPDTGSIPALDKLVPTQSERSALSRFLTAPYGLGLVLGPAGSGKTTTLYSLLRQLGERNLNAYAIGERLAYDIEGVVRVETGKSLSIADALASVLCQNPDVILLESLDDARTIQLAIDAALTGHLVLSAFSAINLDAALMRYELMGGSRAQLLEALTGTISQRLVRKLCPSCRESYEPEQAVLTRLGLGNWDTLYRPKGCTVCQQTGYRGRIGLFEVLALNPEQRGALKQATPMEEIMSSEQRSLKEAGLELLREGLTTPQELLRELML